MSKTKYMPGQVWGTEKETREIVSMDKYEIVYSVRIGRNQFGHWARKHNAKLK